jgi:hypothetical protein
MDPAERKAELLTVIENALERATGEAASSVRALAESEAAAAEEFLLHHAGSPNFPELAEAHMAGMQHRSARALHHLERAQVVNARLTLIEVLRAARLGAAFVMA